MGAWARFFLTTEDTENTEGLGRVISEALMLRRINTNGWGRFGIRPELWLCFFNHRFPSAAQMRRIFFEKTRDWRVVGGRIKRGGRVLLVRIPGLGGCRFLGRVFRWGGWGWFRRGGCGGGSRGWGCRRRRVFRGGRRSRSGWRRGGRGFRLFRDRGGRRWRRVEIRWWRGGGVG